MNTINNENLSEVFISSIRKDQNRPRNCCIKTTQHRGNIQKFQYQKFNLNLKIPFSVKIPKIPNILIPIQIIIDLLVLHHYF